MTCAITPHPMTPTFSLSPIDSSSSLSNSLPPRPGRRATGAGAGAGPPLGSRNAIALSPSDAAISIDAIALTSGVIPNLTCV